jgi:hypothetical protein
MLSKSDPMKLWPVNMPPTKHGLIMAMKIEDILNLSFPGIVDDICHLSSI